MLFGGDVKDGAKSRRKVQSELRCLMVKDMFYWWNGWEGDPSMGSWWIDSEREEENGDLNRKDGIDYYMTRRNCVARHWCNSGLL